ncbi:FIP1[V]-like protein isoform X2 [Daucus carota subsp. sativus]|uniref:FIP1[V]-like protein isoform X2 n=1 Tax=Daucus carota subsp. sativus TaxID=79200 RepID=UPI003083328C
MDSTDDDFGDLYADVEVAASSAINGVLERPNSPAKPEKDEIFEGPRCSDDEFEENASDSEDDFDIVLNDDDVCDGFDAARMRNGEDEENEGKEVIEEAKDGSDKSRMCLDSLQGGEGCERRNVAKVANSQYKYMRPQLSTLASTLKNSKYEGPASYSCPSLKGEQEDTMLYHGMRPKSQGQSLHQFSLPRSRTIVDVNIDAFDEKPWRHPGVDITDYFNFDFDEDSWKKYCNNLDRYRHGDISPARVTSDFSKHNGFYPSRTDHETLAHASNEVSQKGGRMFHKSGSPGKEREHFNMHKGRAIQVAGSITERRSSMDTRRPIDRDSDVVIHIDVQESNETCTLKEQVDPVKCSEQEAYGNGTSGMDDDMDGLTFGSSSEEDLDNESLVGDAFHEGSSMPNSERCSVRTHPPEEAALGKSEGNTKNAETLSKSKEEASRSTCNTATILEAEFPENKCYQYSRSPSFSGSDYEDYRDGARHDLEKSYKYVRCPAPNSLTGFQNSVTPALHHSDSFRSQFGKVKYRDGKDAARYGKRIHQKRDSLYGSSGLKSSASGFRGTSNSVTDRDYGHRLEHDHSRQKDKLYGYSGYHEDEFLYYKETEFSFNFCDERFPDYQIEDVCAKYPRKKGYQRFKIPTNHFLSRNSDERAYRLRDELLERDWDHRESCFTVDGMHPLSCQESRQLSLNYPENEIDTRRKGKGGEPRFTRRIQNDIEFFRGPKYLHGSVQQKYKRTGPYDVRGRNNYCYEYEERLPYTRRGAKSPVRSSRKFMEDSDDFLRSSHHRSFYSRPYRGAHTPKSIWRSRSSTKSDTYERNERQDIYEKHLLTENSQDVDIYGGSTESLNREKDVNNYDDRSYSTIRRYHRESELLQLSEDEGPLMEHNDNYHAETTSFSFERTSWNKRFDAEDRSGHARHVTYDMKLDNLNCKWMSDGEMGKRGYRSSDMYYGGGHDQSLLRCGDPVDVHVIHGEEKVYGDMIIESFLPIKRISLREKLLIGLTNTSSVRQEVSWKVHCSWKCTVQ